MKRIAFLLSIFPEKHKTFEINHMLNAHHAGYEIRIFPHILREPEYSSQPEILMQCGFMDRVITPVIFEINKAKRIEWLLNTLRNSNHKLFLYFIKSLNPMIFGKSGINLMVFHKVIQFYGNSDCDIFHCQFGPNGLIAAWLKELSLIKGKIITTFHGYDAHFDDPNFRRTYHGSSIRTWSPLLFKYSDLITVNTPYLLKQLIELGADPNRVEILPMGVDTSFFLPGDRPHKGGSMQLLSVGRLVKWKCHELGIQAVNNLIKEGFNIDYFIIGDGAERHNLEQLIEKLHLKKHVKMLGARNQSEIKKWLQESDVFLMTSTYDDSGRRETQGVVTAEAQACGLPVVAFRSGGIPYTLEEGKTGFLAEEKNLTEFTQHIRKLCTSETLRKKMGKSARKFVVDNFCQTKLAHKQIVLYEEVLRR